MALDRACLVKRKFTQCVDLVWSVPGVEFPLQKLQNQLVMFVDQLKNPSIGPATGSSIGFRQASKGYSGMQRANVQVAARWH